MTSNESRKDFPWFGDPYEVLGISFPATDAEISRSYKKLALKLHPDKRNARRLERVRIRRRRRTRKRRREEDGPNDDRNDADADADDDDQDHDDDDDDDDEDDDRFERMAQERFHRVKEARAFLLDASYADARRSYDVKRASMLKRKEQEAQRESMMDDRRKRLRDELKRKERRAASSYSHSHSSYSYSYSTGRHKNEDENDDDENDDDENDDENEKNEHTAAAAERVDQLRREGKRMQEELAREIERRTAAETKQKTETTRRKKREESTTERQIRLKWSRKRLSGKKSPTEHSLASMLSEKFGTVERVEFIGSKGNAAIVTFQSSQSCTPCVEFYHTSDEMRAFHLGTKSSSYSYSYSSSPSKNNDNDNNNKRGRRREGQRESKNAKTKDNKDDDTTLLPSKSSIRDSENLMERQLRQAAERERLIRKMMMTKEEGEEEGCDGDGGDNDKHDLRQENDDIAKTKRRPSTSSFPPQFPSDLLAETPFGKLQEMERRVFTTLNIIDTD